VKTSVTITTGSTGTDKVRWYVDGRTVASCNVDVVAG